MNIGELTCNENGAVGGWIAEPTYGFENIHLEKVHSDHPRAPLFDLKTSTPIGRAFRLGSVWEYTAKETGEVYFGGYIESGVSGYVRIRIYRSRQNPNQWNVVRNLPGDRRRSAQVVELPQPPARKRQRKAPVETEREAA